MGLFGGFSKPGPGIDKDAPKKKGLFLYVEIFLRKFWKLVQLNMLYFLFSLPLLILVYFFTPVSPSFIADVAALTGAEGEQLLGMQSAVDLLIRCMAGIGVVTFLGFGLAAPGYSYILRCFTNEIPVFLWSDFWGQIKANAKQGAIILLIDILALLLGINALYFYISSFRLTGQSIWLFIGYLTGILLLIYVMMHAYIYQMMVKFKCSIGQLLRNGAILAIAKLPMNVLLTAIGAALFIAAFAFINPVVALIVFFFLWLSMIRFPMEFYAIRVIDREIIGNKTLAVKQSSDGEE